MDGKLSSPEFKMSDAVEGVRCEGTRIVLPREDSTVSDSSGISRTRDEATIRFLRHVVLVLLDLVEKL